MTPPSAIPNPAPGPPRHVLIDGLSIGSGGGYTVGKELLIWIARARPHWKLTMAVTTGHKLQEEFRREQLPANCQLLWAPAETADRVARLRYERSTLFDWCRASGEGGGVHSILMLNGQVIPGCSLPTLAHNQDPWPYRSEAWTGWKDRVIAFFKRREQGRALRQARICGWTSGYLRDLVCNYHRVPLSALNTPPRSADVFYNGLPDAWIARAESGVGPALDQRRLEIVTVSNVNPYKRQDLVIRALAELRKRPGLSSLLYRVVGQGDPGWVEHLKALAASLNLSDAVVFEGRVSPERVDEVMSSARVFTLMSVCESFGIPAIEAMSLGTPVVVSDCCAHPEICADAAALAREDDLPDLIDKLHRALTDDPYAHDLIRRGRKRVGAFRWSETARKMAEHLEKAME